MQTNWEPGMTIGIEPLAVTERRAILDAVRMTRNAVDAAKALGIGKTTLYRKLNEYAKDKP